MNTTTRHLIFTLRFTILCSLALPAAASSKMDHTQDQLKRTGLTRGEHSLPAVIDKLDGQYRHDGVAVTLSVPAFQAKQADNISMAREFIVARARQLGLSDTDVANLAVTAQRVDGSFSVIRFQQRVSGLPVYGSDIAVTVASDGRILYVASDAVQAARAVSSKSFAVDQQQALDRTRSYLGSSTFTHADTQQIAFVDSTGTHTAWKIRAVAQGSPKGDWEVVIDATSGEVLRAVDKSLGVRGRGLIFNPDPLSSTRSNYGSPGYKDNNDASNPQLNMAQFSAIFPLSISNGLYTLSGPYATCIDFEAPLDNACPTSKEKAFDFDRSSKYFEAVNAYYHLTSYLHYVNKTLGIDAMPYQYSGGVQYDPHGLDGDDNSHYIPSIGKLAFGQGGVDDAEDADVVVHELGHGLHDWLTHGNLSQVEGLSEGVGDFLAAGYSRDLKQWNSTDVQYNWVMNWDGHNEFWPGRSTNWHIGRTYPASVRSASAHQAGQYWSSCNLIARDAIGGQAMDKAFLRGISMTNASSNQKAAAQAVVIAALNMGYSKYHVEAIMNAYNNVCTYGVIEPKSLT
ncbi:M36 family metallopeptidase [Burkholderia ambifaria]|uniref:Metallopeptidase domain protein n=1 Tax=Burkholderia ambifaria MEX-5 TaxID=396597 RepID=B1TFM9_9BURK|nr:M36 family metallopeptidase [Burkholderia ambifaria]EDT37625.1 metallopeptidase domain protein [Burkholderia ambifaria MEX-5]